MILLISVVLFIVLLLMGVPIAYGMLATTLFGMSFVPNVDLITVTQKMLSGLNSFTLLAVPMFIMAANLMNIGNISQQLVDFCLALVGHIKGGMAYANVLVSMVFAGISGSSQADTAGIGKILIPGMVDEGYPLETAVGVTVSSSTLGVIIPPSIPMVSYGISVNASIATMFMGGFLPGIVLGTLLIITAVYVCKKNGFTGNGEQFSWKKVGASFKDAFWAILSPVIILGGIYSGVFTPTEAAVVSVVYALLVGIFAYKELNTKNIYKKFAEAACTHGTVNIIVGTSTILGRVLTLEQIPDAVATSMIGFTDNKIIIMLIINLLLLGCGCLLETNSSILILAPILYPVAASFGVDIVHFGIIMVVNLAIGFITPPVGVNLFVACGIGNIPFAELVKKIIPFLLVLLVGLLLITYIPAITLTIPRILGYQG